jgi:hypothetical protein
VIPGNEYVEAGEGDTLAVDKAFPVRETRRTIKDIDIIILAYGGKIRSVGRSPNRIKEFRGCGGC